MLKEIVDMETEHLLKYQTLNQRFNQISWDQWFDIEYCKDSECTNRYTFSKSMDTYLIKIKNRINHINGMGAWFDTPACGKCKGQLIDIRKINPNRYIEIEPNQMFVPIDQFEDLIIRENVLRLESKDLLVIWDNLDQLIEDYETPSVVTFHLPKEMIF